MGKRLIVAIATSIIELVHCTYYTNYPYSTVEKALFTFIAFGYMLIFFYLKDEVKAVIQDRKSKKTRSKKIIFHDCERERKIKEFQAERAAFFDNYFKRSSIEVSKTLK